MSESEYPNQNVRIRISESKCPNQNVRTRISEAECPNLILIDFGADLRAMDARRNQPPGHRAARYQPVRKPLWGNLNNSFEPLEEPFSSESLLGKNVRKRKKRAGVRIAFLAGENWIFGR